MRISNLFLACASLFFANVLLAQVPQDAVMITVEDHGKAISPNLFGIFFEDLSYAADGGLYAELLQNRSFEYSPADRKGWTPLTGWQLNLGEGAKAKVSIEDTHPLNANNPNYAVLAVEQPGQGVRLENDGFDGVTIKAGETYHLSLFARQLSGVPIALQVRLESKNGDTLATGQLQQTTQDWAKYTIDLKATRSDDKARFVLLDRQAGSVALDVVSLFPDHTFRGHPNGMRADLAETIATLKPKFIRFPGGCLVHGDGLANMYRWKETIGPIETRAEQPDLWRYHQTLGLGFFEYFQFAEDIGATPLPVVAAGVSCQNSGEPVQGKWDETGQMALPLDEMPAYMQDVLDLIEYANGPVTSVWGAKRAAAGHPEPFHLRYIGVGNEDRQTDAFRERFAILYRAIKAKYPEITVVGTVGPRPDGEDFEAGWKFASQIQVPAVDEHYYETPEWFLANQHRYDNYPRNGSHVYVGEYAATDRGKTSTLRSALAEAAFMTGLERNGDIVLMSSYAPLLAKNGHTNWNPDLIHFTNTDIFPSVSYFVQQMFSTNSGDTYLDAAVDSTSIHSDLSFSAVRDSKNGDVVLKAANNGASPLKLHFTLHTSIAAGSTGIRTSLSGDLATMNSGQAAPVLVPASSTFIPRPEFDEDIPAHSLTVLRIQSPR